MIDTGVERLAAPSEFFTANVYVATLVVVTVSPTNILQSEDECESKITLFVPTPPENIYSEIGCIARPGVWTEIWLVLPQPSSTNAIPDSTVG